MSTNCYELYDKVNANKADRDQSENVKKVRRRQITGEDEFAQNEKATSPEYTDNIDGSKLSGTVDNGLTDIKDYHMGKRLLRITVLAICFFVIEFIAKTVTVAQFIFVVWQKRPHPGMQRLGTMIAEYMHDLWRYCTFASDDAPWPFRR